jgi:5-methylcytosine-specific restriction endonuclease McrA
MERAKVAVHARFRCEYCDLEFLKSAENYRQWQWDHIIPKESGGIEGPENLAAACWTCNFCFKNKWNPQKVVGPNAPRSKLIEATREYIAQEKQRTEKEYLQAYRAIVQRTGLSSG